MSLAYVLVQLSHGLECLRPNRCHLALVHRNLGASLRRRGVVATTLTFWSVPVIVSTAALYHIHLCMKPCVKCKSDAPGYCNCCRGVGQSWKAQRNCSWYWFRWFCGSQCECGDSVSRRCMSILGLCGQCFKLALKVTRRKLTSVVARFGYMAYGLRIWLRLPRLTTVTTG